MGGAGKCESVNTDASEAARCSCPLAFPIGEEGLTGDCGVLGSGGWKLAGERAFCWGNADGGGPGERLSDGGGASSRLRSRSGFRGERGKGDETVPTVVFERIGVGSARACICANADGVGGGEMGFGLVGARGRGGSAAGQPPDCGSCDGRCAGGWGIGLAVAGLDMDCECSCVGRELGDVDRNKIAAMRDSRLASAWPPRLSDGGTGDGSSRRARGVPGPSAVSLAGCGFLRDGRSRIPNCGLGERA